MAETHNIFLQRLQDAGYKLTNARRTVLAVLQDNDGHITSSDVLDMVSAVDDTIGRASVFRTLDLLTRLGIIRPTYIDNAMTPTYVLMAGGHHHHIICTNCHQVIEFDDCGLGEITRTLEAKYQVELTGHLLEFYGQCADCNLVDN